MIRSILSSLMLAGWRNGTMGRVLRLPSSPSIPNALRVYVVGDIHGQRRLFARLLSMIEEDDQRRGSAKSKIIVLGDFIDRGLGAASLLRSFHAMRALVRLDVLKGNHEAALVDAVNGDFDAARLWMHQGGDATLAGFGAPVQSINLEHPEQIIEAIKTYIPDELIDWLEGLPVHRQIGDYYFAHAGVRPGIPLRRQKPADLLWIREPFLSSDKNHGAIVVHGHSVEEHGPVFAVNRIGLDTGAYRTGRLVALGLQGSDRWVIEASDPQLLETKSFFEPAFSTTGAN